MGSMKNVKTVAVFEKQFTSERRVVIMTLLDDNLYSVKKFIEGEYNAEATSHNLTEANKIMLEMIEECL